MLRALEEHLSEKSSFYRHHYQTFIFILIAMIFIMLAMVTVVLYQVSHRPLPQFNAVAPDGKLLSLTASDGPNLQSDVLLRWASKAAVAAYTFDFVNYNKQINLAHSYFTSDGWGDYQASVSNLIRSITQKQLFVNGVVSGAPIISNQGYISGRGYVWRVQMPFLVTYQSSEKTTRQDFYVIMTIVKIPTSQNPTGIGIDQFVMR